MTLTPKESLIIDRAKLHVKTHTATEQELLLLKILDEKIQDISYDCFELYKQEKQLAEGIELFSGLSTHLIKCVEYLQSRKNSIYESMDAVSTYADEVIWNKSEESNKKTAELSVLFTVYRQMEEEKEHSIDDLSDIAAALGYKIVYPSYHLAYLVRLGLLERTKRGTYKKGK